MHKGKLFLPPSEGKNGSRNGELIKGDGPDDDGNWYGHNEKETEEVLQARRTTTYRRKAPRTNRIRVSSRSIDCSITAMRLMVRMRSIYLASFPSHTEKPLAEEV